MGSSRFLGGGRAALSEEGFHVRPVQVVDDDSADDHLEHSRAGAAD